MLHSKVSQLQMTNLRSLLVLFAKIRNEGGVINRTSGTVVYENRTSGSGGNDGQNSGDQNVARRVA